MDYKRTPEWHEEHKDMSGEEMERQFGGHSANWRRAKRAAVGEPEPVKPRVGIAVFDLHFPDHDTRLWQNILRYTKTLDPDIFVFGGDNLTLDVVSHWIDNKRGKVEGKRLKADYLRFNRSVLDPLSVILRDDTQRVFHFGNHEDWVRQYLEVHPEMEGLIEIEQWLHLDGWKVLQYGETAKFGHLYSMHGTHINLHNAYKTAQVYGRSIMYGHGHTLQAHTLVTPLDSLPYAATQIPCACKMNPHYRRNQPNSWVNGFATFYVRPDGQFNLYPVVAIDGSFTAPDGTFYE